MEHVIRELFVPIFYTSMTTATGFASLALVPIPPVQVFGLFVALGVLLAWLLSISFIPAYIFLVRRDKIEVLAEKGIHDGTPRIERLGRFLQRLRVLALDHARAIVGLSMVLAAAFVYGISQTVVNDNPIRWFQEDHTISIADRKLNEHFGGTYMAYLAVRGIDLDSADLQAEWQLQLTELGGRYTGSDLLTEALTTPFPVGLGYGPLLDAIERRVEVVFDQDDITEQDELLLEDSLEWLDARRV